LSFRANYIKKDTFFNKKNSLIILNINKLYNKEVLLTTNIKRGLFQS